ncbi:MAG: alpha/beta fold hydrolase, partial [Acidobacteriota bacterium]
MERLLDLPHRGRLRVLDLPGPPGAPVVVLLHGLAATSALNWGPSLQALAQDFRVLAPDHRGHGGGLPLRAPFRLEKCADDIAALTEFLQIDRFVAVGYSMGGAIAQLTWRRHRERVAGLVLCATAARFASSRQRQASYLIQPFASIAARGAPDSFWKAQAQRMLENVPDPDRRRHLAAEIEGTQPAAIIEAAGALARFDSRPWL